MNILDLPNEILCEILLNVDYNSLLSMALTCHKFNNIFKYCRKKLKNKFIKTITTFKPTPKTNPKLSTCFIYQYSQFPNGTLHGKYIIYKQLIENNCYYHHMLSYCKYYNGVKSGFEVKFVEDKISSITRWKNGKKEGECIKYQYIIDENHIYVASMLKYIYSNDMIIDKKSTYYDNMPILNNILNTI
jgi:hypothetical protein